MKDTEVLLVRASRPPPHSVPIQAAHLPSLRGRRVRAWLALVGFPRRSVYVCLLPRAGLVRYVLPVRYEERLAVAAAVGERERHQPGACPNPA